jgi:hypothetical protein
MVMVNPSSNDAVIVRLGRTIQFAATSRLESKRLGLLDARVRGHDHDWGTDV